ncbi:MAG: recombinase family protein, partial [Promethearchaeota archaeon]
KAYSDVGSGLNDKRKGLLTLLRDATAGKFDVVLVSYKDRLARFGLQLIETFLNSWNVSLELILPHVVEDTPHGELITDLTAILYSFMGKLYRMRRGSPRKKNKKEIENFVHICPNL